jgi:4,5:9,10-diseco-3-hydroxy-5,9,17-trioxoandrosta-1(10),2-diene-4-oate hydrolase
MSQHPIPEHAYVTLDDGLRLHYQDLGRGTPVVFLHGSGPGASGYSNFKRTYPAFVEAGYRAIVPDLPGYGLSDKPENAEYVLDFFVAAMHGLLDKLNIERCVLVGNSLGGAIALKYALDYPDQVQAQILMAPGGVEERETYFQMEGIQKMVAAFGSGPIDREGMRTLMSLQLFDPTLIDDELLTERAAICATQPRTVLSTMRVPNFTERLREIRCPTLTFWGMNDRFNPSSGAAKIAAGIPDSRVTLLNRCGHWVMVEHRAYFNRMCLDFLAEH